MAKDHEFSCTCGAFHARVVGVAPGDANRVICYCESCQKFARELDAEGRLEAGGGTDIVQISAGRLEVMQGEEFMTPMQLTEKGPLRWSTSCCNTPIGTSAGSPKLPFIGLNNRVVGLPEEISGPVRSQLYRQKATETVPVIGEGRGMVAVVMRFGKIILAAWLRGDHKRSPFFGPNRKPIAQVRRLHG